MSRAVRSGLALATALCCLACDDSLGPTPPGEYDLVRTNDRLLPVQYDLRVWEPRGRCAEEVRAGTLVLAADDTYELRLALGSTCLDGANLLVSETPLFRSGSYELNAGALTFTNPDTVFRWGAARVRGATVEAEARLHGFALRFLFRAAD